MKDVIYEIVRNILKNKKDLTLVVDYELIHDKTQTADATKFFLQTIKTIYDYPPSLIQLKSETTTNKYYKFKNFPI